VPAVINIERKLYSDARFYIYFEPAPTNVQYCHKQKSFFLPFLVATSQNIFGANFFLSFLKKPKTLTKVTISNTNSPDCSRA
jgi:hypothetical protein